MSRLLREQMYGDNKLGHRVTGKKHIPDPEPPPAPGDHVKIERNAGGRVVGVVAFLLKEGQVRSFHIDEVRALDFISDPSLIDDSPEDFLHTYGPGLIDLARFRWKTEQKKRRRTQVEASESWMSDEQREVIRSLAE